MMFTLFFVPDNLWEEPPVIWLENVAYFCKKSKILCDSPLMFTYFVDDRSASEAADLHRSDTLPRV